MRDLFRLRAEGGCLMSSHADLCYLSISELSRLIRGRKVSPVEVTSAVLDRISKTQPITNAFIRVCADEALRDAKASEAALAAGQRKPLLGVPVAVKDVVDMEGHPTTCASAALEHNVANADSTVVARLRAAGAIIVGKTNLTEFAERFVSPPYGVVRNPWALDRCAGLSSSGSAAAVVSGASFGAIGNDTGGSIRVPASYCGCVGIKPTYGRVGRAGAFPSFSSMDCVGPLARMVKDCAIMLKIIAGPDALDQTADHSAVPDFPRGLPIDLKGVRAGVCRRLFFEGIDPEVERCIEDALDTLKALGALVVETDVPSVGLTSEARAPLQEAETAEAHAALIGPLGHLYGEELAQRVRLAGSTTAVAYLRAQQLRAQMSRDLTETFESVHVLVSPTTSGAAYTSGPGMPGYKEPLVDGELPAGRASPASPFSLTGFPAISVPCGFTGEGLPVGMQIAGPMFGERTLFRVAHAYESSASWHTRRPDL